MDAYDRVALRARRRRAWLACALAATLVLLMAPAPSASALGVERMTAVQEEQIEAITEWVYRNGATSTAPPCGSVCTALWLSEHRPMPNQATSAQLWAELNMLQQSPPAKQGVGLVPNLGRFVRTLSPYANAVFLGAESFRLGWKIGGRINKWLGIDVPADPPGVAAYSLQWFEEGSTEPFPTYHETMEMPYDGFAVMSNSTAGIVGQRVAGPFACDQPGPSSLPDGFTPLTWWWNDCWAGYEYPLYPVTAIGLVAKPELLVPRPVEDFDGQTVDAETEGVTDPGTEVVEERLADALDSGKYPTLNQWLDDQLGGASENPLCEAIEGVREIAIPAIMPGQTAASYEECLDTLGLTEHVRVTVPVEQAVLTQPARGVVSVEPAEGEIVDLEEETEVEIRINPDPLPDADALDETQECHLSTGEYPVAPPANDPTPAPFDQITDSLLVAESTFPALYGPTMLRWGSVMPYEEEAEEEDPSYPGWGYQHIKAKHGWSRADDTATRTALTTAGFADDEDPDSYTYVGPEYVQSSVPCVRLVIVNYGVEERASGAKHIITSYGRDVRTLPGFMHPTG